MERDVRYFWTGLFVLVTLVCMAAFIAWIAGTYDNRKYDRYTIFFTNAVTGLNTGSVVRYQGIEVGSVLSIRLSDYRRDLVKVDIEIIEDTPVKSTTSATLGMMGITGITFIEIKTPPEDKLPAAKIASEPYPIILGSASQLTQLFETMPKILDNFLMVSDKMNKFLDPETMTTLQKAAQNIEQVTRDFNGLLSPQNTAYVAQTLQNAATASESFTEMAARLDKTAVQIENTAKLLGTTIMRNEEAFNQYTREGVDQVMRLTEESRATATAIRDLADKLGHDPSQIIYQPNYHGVEIPQ